MSRSTLTSTGLAVTLVAVMALIVLPGLAAAESHSETDVASQVKAQILKDNAETRKTKKDTADGYAKEGALEFWSSGGLMQSVDSTAPLSKYTSFAITPKHIKVIELPGGQAAVAMYYSEGSMQVEGMSPVSHYMTRVTQVYVKEGDQWKVRAAHWSPIAGGSGTVQTSTQ